LQNFDDCCRGTLVMLAACGFPENAPPTPDTIPSNVPTTAAASEAADVAENSAANRVD
jgi:hypothetical protein